MVELLLVLVSVGVMGWIRNYVYHIKKRRIRCLLSDNKDMLGTYFPSKTLYVAIDERGLINVYLFVCVHYADKYYIVTKLRALCLFVSN